MNPRDLPPIVTSAQMQAIDRYAIETLGIPSLTLMENAGRGVAERIRDGVLSGDCLGVKIAVVCGKGNNGGDGFVTARYLAQFGTQVSIFLLGRSSELSPDAAVNASRATEAGLRIDEIVESGSPSHFDDFDLLIDAILGTGFRGKIEGVVAETIDSMNASGLRIVAIDAPSGVDGENGNVSSSTVIAGMTTSLAATKRGQWLWPARKHVGLNETIDIGIPSTAFATQDVRLNVITEDFVRQSLPMRPPEAHKGTFGKAFILGGSVGMSGAVVLAANSAMRSGVGLTYVGVPESLADTVDAGAVESVIRPLPEVSRPRVLARRGAGEIRRLIQTVDAVAIGPGLSTHPETQELVRRLVATRTKPTMLDADGLNACAREPAVLEIVNPAPLIITPHVGEMARLLGKSTAEVAADRESAAREAARRFHCIAVMKGAPTFVSDPEGYVYLNPTGNSGMATGGVGDVLTGIIVSLLAQGCEPLTAALMGVYIHGLAGDLAAKKVGERSLVASDLIAALPDAFKDI